MPIKKSTPIVSFCDCPAYIVQSQRRIKLNNSESGQFAIQRSSIDLATSRPIDHLKSTENIFTIAKVLTVLDPNNHSCNNFPISPPFRRILSAYLTPKHRGAIKYPKTLCVINFNATRNIRTVNKGSIIAKTRLHQVHSFVEVLTFVHEDIMYIFD